ncbi:MAG: hypothetical protein PHS37_01525 [Candidatus Omnitrophica bacterium]|nr:hypothetical protein [Candidatus Omnitrophota bacterium]
MEEKPKWYHRPYVIIGALLMLGPFALPLVWSSPAMSRLTKIILTLIVFGLTYWLVMVTVDTYTGLMKQLKELGLL